MTMQDQFCELYRAYINRPGADELIEYLTEKTDFLTAPASTRYHLSEAEGLVTHSVHVYQRLREMYKSEKIKAAKGGPAPLTWEDEEKIAICGLLHDVCKCNCYHVSTRNVKKDGVWTRVPYYSFDDPIPYGHGEKSVYIISGFMRLTREEAFAIRYHMGFSGNDDYRTLGKAFGMYPLAVMTHLADMQATYFDEREETK